MPDEQGNSIFWDVAKDMVVFQVTVGQAQAVNDYLDRLEAQDDVYAHNCVVHALYLVGMIQKTEEKTHV